MGLVAEVYDKENLAALEGHIAIGHVLYSTSGKATIENAQPFVSRSKLGTIAVITSYSIHYTKLYDDERAADQPARDAGVLQPHPSTRCLTGSLDPSA